MFEDYKEKVILAYQKKKEASDISMNLLRPTPGKLRNECLSVFGERCLLKDEKILRLFFGPKDKLADYGQSISKIEIDKFRPLINFLKRRTNVTDERNIELLAWLIDFEPRPYQYGFNYKEDITTGVTQDITGNSDKIKSEVERSPTVSSSYGNDEAENKEVKAVLSDISAVGNETVEENIIREEIEVPEDGKYLEEGNDFLEEVPFTEEKEVIEETGSVNHEIQSVFENFDRPKEPVPDSKLKKAIASLMIIIVVASGSMYLLISNEGEQKCMYWTGDHYKSISCNKKIEDAAVIALDTGKVAHFKKITEPDTLTQSSVGKVWYTKIDGGIEFYTADGVHPVYNEVRLKPVTVYILNKYIHRN